MKHYTSIEQSKKLLELGLNPDTADMVYFKFLVSTPNSKDWEWGNLPMILGDIPRKEIPEETLPCWSLSALLELMPIGAHIEKRNNSYACYIVYNKPYEADTPIETAYTMIVWLLENNYITK